MGSVAAPLGAVGCPFADSDCNNSAQKCPKDHLSGIVKIVIFLCVYWCFMTLARPNGRPNDTLEAFLDHLVTHKWHLGDSFGTSKHHFGAKCEFGSTFGDLFSVVCGSRVVNVGKGKSLEAIVGPAEGGEASPPSFAEVL